MPDSAAEPRSEAPEPPRRPIFGASFIFMMVFSLSCLIGGYLFATFGPRLFPVRPDPAAPAAAGAVPPPETVTSVQRLPLTAPATAGAPPAQVWPASETDLSLRLLRLESGQAAVVQAAAAALAAANLTQAAQAGRPFPAEADAAVAALPGNADALALRPLAAIGAPSRAALAAEFLTLDQTVAIAADQPPPGAGLLAGIGHALGSVVTVRRTETDPLGRPTALLQLERLVAAGDLEPALALVARMPPGVRERLASWRIRAERRVEIDRRTAMIRAGALARLQVVIHPAQVPAPAPPASPSPGQTPAQGAPATAPPPATSPAPTAGPAT